jgi:uncharacterized protein YndB with AHSA1/START domain
VNAAVVENEVEIESSPEEVFDYATDLSREHEWNPKTRRVEKLTDGPIGAGTRFEATFLKGDPMTIEVLRFEGPRVWESVGRSRRMKATTYGAVTATHDGARLTMRMELRPRHVPRALLPLLGAMHRQQERNLAAVKRCSKADHFLTRA